MSDDTLPDAVPQSPYPAGFIMLGSELRGIAALALDIVLANDDWVALGEAYNVSPIRLQRMAIGDKRLSAEIASIVQHSKALGSNWRILLRAQAAADNALEHMALIASGKAAGANPDAAIKAFKELRELLKAAPEPSNVNNGMILNFHSPSEVPAEVLTMLAESVPQEEIIDAEEIWDDA